MTEPTVQQLADAINHNADLLEKHFNEGVYVHNQTTAADVWNIQHNMGILYIKALFIDADGKEFVGVVYDYENSTVNMLRVLVGDPIAGRAIIN